MVTAPQFSLAKDRINVLLLGGIHSSAREVFLRDGYTRVELLKQELAEEELMERIANVHLLGIRPATTLSAAVLARAPKLLAVGCFCIGTNQVDLLSAKRSGIAVFNAPFSNTRSVAELVIAEIILLLRDIPAKNAALHRGEWRKSAKGSYEVRGKTLGIVGYGHIGTQVGVLAESLGMRVLYHDIESKLSLGNAAPTKSLAELLGESDVVTLHVPGGASTKNLIGAAELRAMKRGASLINAARGQIIDTEALRQALGDGHLAGAAIDVHPAEPASTNQAFSSPLIGLENVLLTPHIAGSTMEAQERIGAEVAEKLVSYSNTGSTTGAVNFPVVQLPSQEGKHRILHVHRNQPGALMAINAAFAALHVNISGQYLQTDSDIGYVVTDVDAAVTPSMRTALKSVPGTIRTRLLY